MWPMYKMPHGVQQKLPANTTPTFQNMVKVGMIFSSKNMEVVGVDGR